MDQIVTLLQFEPKNNYREWKAQCKNIILKFNSVFLRADEKQLESIFAVLLTDLKKDISSTTESSVLRSLIKIAIFFNFQETFVFPKDFAKLIKSNFETGNETIVHCTGILIYWISLRTKTATAFYKRLIQKAVVWLKASQLSNLWYSSMVILAYAAKLNQKDAITCINETFYLILQMVNSSNQNLQNISLKVLNHFFQQASTSFSKNRIYQFTLNSISIINRPDSNAAYGSLRLFSILTKGSLIFDDEIAQNMANALIYSMKTHQQPTDYESFKFFLTLIQNNKILYDFKEITNFLIMKPIYFVPLFRDFVKFSSNSDFDFIDIFTRYYSSHKEFSQGCQNDYCSFELLKAIFEISPDIEINFPLPIHLYCRHYCECIELRPELFEKNYIPELKRCLYDSTADYQLRLSAIHISRQFSDWFFSDIDEQLKCLSSFFNDPNDEIRKETILSLTKIDDDRAIDFLSGFLNADLSKQVRLFAIDHIPPSPQVAMKLHIFQCLNDSSMKIRRKGIKLLLRVLKYNHIEFDPLMYQYYNKMVILLFTSHDSHICAKIATIFPSFFNKTDGIYQVEKLAVFTIAFILRLVGPPNRDFGIPMEMRNNVDKLDTYSPLPQETPKKARINRFIREPDIDKRDIYLIKTLAKLGKLTEPYLNEILETFCYIFETRTSESLLEASIKSLTKLSSKLYHGLNIRLRCPQIISPLLKIMYTTQNTSLGISLLKLFGSAFDSLEVVEEEKIQELPFNPDDPYFYTDFVISSLLNNFTSSSIQFFESLGMILDSDSRHAAKYIPQVLPKFMKEIDLIESKFQNKLFSFMEVLPFKYKDELRPFLDSFTPFILKHIKLINCVQFVSALSYCLQFSFINVASNIYYYCVSIMTLETPLEYFKQLLKLNASMIIYQNQSFEIFINQISMLLNTNDFPPLSFSTIILNTLIGIVQMIPDVSLIRSSIVLLADLLHRRGVDVTQLLLSLAIFSRTSPYVFLKASSLIQSFNDFLERENLMDDIEKVIHSPQPIKINEIPYLEDHQIIIQYTPLSSSFEPPTSYFTDIECPYELSISNNWIIDLLRNFVEVSPLASIRACKPLISISFEFGFKLLPIAFYSCWSVASENDRRYFSDIVNHILSKVTNIPDIIFDLIELADRWALPLDVDIMATARLCKSHQYSILLTERYLKNHPHDVDTMNFLLETYFQMNRNATALSLFKKNQHLFDKMTIAKWSGKLGDWTTAYNIYKELNAPATTIIHCLAHLRRADEIVSYFPNIDTEMSNEELAQMSKPIFWAYHITGNDENVVPLLNISPTYFDPAVLMAFVYYSLKSTKIDTAQKIINKVYRILNEWRLMVHSGDQYKVNNIHNLAQIFIEAEEALRIKKKHPDAKEIDISEIKEKWEQRVKGFKRETTSWEMFLLLKNLIIPCESNATYYFKIISSLRKYGQFVLINDYFTKAFDRTTDLRVVVERIKIIWSAGQWENALKEMENLSKLFLKSTLNLTSSSSVYFQSSFLNQLCTFPRLTPKCHQFFVDHFHTDNLTSLYETIEKTSPEIKGQYIDFIFQNFSDEIEKLLNHLSQKVNTPDFQAKIFRLTGSYLVQLYDIQYDALKRAEKYFEASIRLKPNNNKAWKWWAYLNAKLFFLTKSRNLETAKKSVHIKPNRSTPFQPNSDQNTDKRALLRSIASTSTLQQITTQEEPNNHNHHESISGSNSQSQIQLVLPQIPQKPNFLPIQPKNYIRTAKNKFSVYESAVLLTAHDHANPIEINQNRATFLASGGGFFGRALNFLRKTSEGIHVRDANSQHSSNDDSNSDVFNEDSIEVFDDIGPDKSLTFAINAINGFLHAIKMDPKMSLTYLCKMFSVVFCLKMSSEMPRWICNRIGELPSEDLLKVVPQITAHIDHPDKAIRKMISEILSKLGEDHFQEIFFPLELYSDDKSSLARSSIASKILSTFKLTKPILYSDADLFTDGMIRSATTWFESWSSTIENIIRLQNSSKELNNETQHSNIALSRINKNRNKEMIIQIISNKLEEFDNPKCDLDHLFQQFYQSYANEVRNLYRLDNPNAAKRLHDVLRSWYQSLKTQISYLSCIILEKVSRELSAKRHFSIHIPNEDQNNKILSIDPILEIMGTQQRPRCLFINSEQGTKFKYLLKGNEDIRVDERLMQFFNLVNIVMKDHRNTREFQSFISCYTVIPLTKLVGLIGWVTNADTMHQLIKEYRTQKNIDIQIENNLVEKQVGVSFTNLNSLQRLEAYELVMNMPLIQCEEINEMMWMRSKSAAACLKAKRIFTETTALMSMVGYVIGLGDRHPSNIMIQRDFGNIIHIDFGESFDSAMNRRICPEVVPFRLTTMMINTLEGKDSHGSFMEACELFMGVMRENHNALSAQLAIFSDDPVFDREKVLLGNIDFNLNRTIYNKLAGYKTGKNGDNESVSEQVKRLIEMAENPKNYIKHFPGWCPFW